MMNSFPQEEWWALCDLEIVEDRSRIWVYKKFKPVDGIWEINNGQKLLRMVEEGKPLPKNAIIGKNAWDHEHCALCWAKIMESNTTIQAGFTDGDKWLCPACYNKYIVPRLG